MKRISKISIGVISGILISVITLLLLIQSNWILGPKNILRDKGYLYIIGTGPAGPQMATLQALDAIEKMDVILAPSKHALLFMKYIKNTPVLFNPWEGFFDYKGKKYFLLNKEELELYKKECFRLRDERIERIKQLIIEGKNVGILDSGNPCMFGPSHWYIENFDSKDIVIIPGMGSDAAALSVLKKSIIPANKSRFVIQTSPFFLFNLQDDNHEILNDLKKYNANMILYMALEEPEKLFTSLKQIYPSDMPCAVVYFAGFPLLEKVFKGTLKDIEKKISEEDEKYMGLLFIGDFLDEKPYETSMKESLRKLSM